MNKATVFKVLRIIFCILCALCLAACVFVFIYLGNVWGIATLVGAAGFFALTMLFKTLQQDEEKKNGTYDDTADNHHQTDDTPAAPSEHENGALDKDE